MVMKECPKCRQLFAYPNLRFCRYDGSRLIDGPTSMHEATTLLFSTGQIHQRTATLDEQRRKSESGKK